MLRNHSALGFELRLPCYKLVLVGLYEIIPLFKSEWQSLDSNRGCPATKQILVSLYENLPVAFLSALN